MGETIELKAKDGATISAYKAVPAGTPRGGLVVVQEIFGVNHHIRAVADGYAADGYLVIAPAIFDRIQPGVELGYGPADFEKGFELYGKVKIEDALLDIEAAVTAATVAGKVGVVGYCFGGKLTYESAAKLSGVAAAVGYYGAGIAANLAEELKAPVQLHFGERDIYIPLSDVEKIKAAHPDIEVHVYPANHGFNCSERESYDKASADVARQRALDFFARHLG